MVLSWATIEPRSGLDLFIEAKVGWARCHGDREVWACGNVEDFVGIEGYFFFFVLLHPLKNAKMSASCWADNKKILDSLILIPSCRIAGYHSDIDKMSLIRLLSVISFVVFV